MNFLPKRTRQYTIVLVVALTTIAFWACQNTKSKQQEEDPNWITCERIGPVYKNTTKAALVETFGQEQLQDGTRDFNGVSKQITRVFPDKPEEVTVVWADDANTVEKLIIWNENGPYHTKENLKVGIDLRDVVRINNFLPVTFANFYSNLDGYGNILSFNGGEIEKNYPCLKGTLDIVRLKGVDAYALEDFKKIDTVKSGDRMVQNMVVKVSEISIQ